MDPPVSPRYLEDTVTINNLSPPTLVDGGDPTAVAEARSLKSCMENGAGHEEDEDVWDLAEDKFLPCLEGRDVIYYPVLTPGGHGYGRLELVENGPKYMVTKGDGGLVDIPYPAVFVDPGGVLGGPDFLDGVLLVVLLAFLLI